MKRNYEIWYCPQCLRDNERKNKGTIPTVLFPEGTGSNKKARCIICDMDTDAPKHWHYGWKELSTWRNDSSPLIVELEDDILSEDKKEPRIKTVIDNIENNDKDNNMGGSAS